MKNWLGIAAALLLVLGTYCKHKSRNKDEPAALPTDTLALAAQLDTVEPPLLAIPVTKAVNIGAYFKFVDAIVQQYDSLVPYPLTEHLLVRANAWLIDTLENTDYYRLMERDSFVYDQRQMLALRPGDTLYLPGEKTAATLLNRMQATHLDINIPSFQLRIVEGDSVLHSFPVRVGKNQKKFLALAGNVVDLRTRTGAGEIVRISRDPLFLDPVTGKKFKYTRRDDRRTTRMPLIPWIEPSINGIRHGQMIHPTTNPSTLGKASSNGCIGLKEADAWRVYYYAPIGTKVVVRYDLMETLATGDTLRYEDVYRYRKGGTKPSATQAALFPVLGGNNGCWCGE
ncbi:MAG: L,D-transpeptidase [Saprospiraceae bacterium]|nr:L,D-transpeptidase [Saprospiraceae bacterium]